MKSLIWISYDLGIRGDYEGMYTFLDYHSAKECGDSNAVLWFEYNGDLLGELKLAIESQVSLNRRSRIYVISPGDRGKHAGRFIVGRRKQPPWAGFSQAGSDEGDDVE